MTGRVMELEDILEPDQRAIRITEEYIRLEDMRKPRKAFWEEVVRYVYATDTTQTSNRNLPWKNKTTIPKLCQIMDNLYANYTATLLPKQKGNVVWESDQEEQSIAKTQSIQNYTEWSMSQRLFAHELDKIILDFIQYGNAIATVEWIDQRVTTSDGRTQAGYIGAMPRRISPLDIVFNPTAENFESTPKIVRSVISMGELKKLLNRLSNDENREEYQKLWEYLRNIRRNATTFEGDWIQKDSLFQMDGFGSFRDYLNSDFVEVLTFYGDMYDKDTGDLYENYVMTVVDRHKLIGSKPNPSYFGTPPIYHAAWRKKQDNLWGMGPLENLIGMQYRLDHIENMKADIFDLITYPVQKVKGFVEDFTWQPGEKIFLSEGDSDVELVVPDVNALSANLELQELERKMEEMAGAPKEAMGFRTPGEKTKYEVQRLENAASRIFQNKIKQFSELLESILNAMLEMARRNLTGTTVIKVFDNEFNVASFQSLTVEDITGVGRIKPISIKHFAEQTELVQNLTNLANSNLWPIVQPHYSGIKIAKVLSSFFNLDEYEVFSQFVSLTEQAEGQKLMHALEEQVQMTAGTATGMGEDFDLNAMQQQQSNSQFLSQLQGQAA